MTHENDFSLADVRLDAIDPQLRIDRYEEKPHGNNLFRIAGYSSDTFGSNCHHHLEYELITITEGELHLKVNGEHVTLLPGYVAYLDKGAVHHIDYDCTLTGHVNDSGIYTKYYSIVFDSSTFGIETDACKVFFDTYQIVPMIDDSDFYITKRLVEIFELLQQADNKNYFGVKTKLFEIMCQIIETKQYIERDTVARKKDNAPVAIRKVLEYIQANYKNKITLDDIAKITHYSPAYISHLFNKYSSCNITKHITNIRIEAVCKDLVTTDKSVMVILAENGFDSPSHFHKEFKNTCHCTPTQYRTYHQHKKIQDK